MKKSYYQVCSCSTGWYQPDWRNWIHPVTGIKHRSLKEAWKSYSKCRRGADPQPNMYYDVRLLRMDDDNNVEMVCTDDQSEDDAFWARKVHGETPDLHTVRPNTVKVGPFDLQLNEDRCHDLSLRSTA